VVYKKRQFQLENLTINSTLKQSKSIEISKYLVSSYKSIEREEGWEGSALFFWGKKHGWRTYQGQYRALIIDRDNEAPSAHGRALRDWDLLFPNAYGLPFLWRDDDRGSCGTGTSSSSGGTTTARLPLPQHTCTSHQARSWHQIIPSSSLKSSAKITIYPNLIRNSLIRERERERSLHF
jgi:hypothetical protein